jgi:uncharacterized paraquat-inducible protein A
VFNFLLYIINFIPANIYPVVVTSQSKRPKVIATASAIVALAFGSYFYPVVEAIAWISFDKPVNIY